MQNENEMRFTYSGSARGERGSALISALLVVSALSMLGLSMLSAGISGSRVVTGQADEYRLTSAVESVGALTAEEIWSAYLRNQGGAAGTITSFRNYLTSIGIADSGPGGAPSANQGIDRTVPSGIPGAVAGDPEFDDVNVDALRVLRRDEGDSTHLYVTVSASTKRGEGVLSRPQNRALQIVYTVEPAAFEGFDYGILTNNVNCVFCHTVIDSTDRVFNHDPSLFGTFSKVKVGTLESLMLRGDARPTISDADADSMLAGALYVRGHATNHNGIPIPNSSWSSQSFHSSLFDDSGNLIEDGNGNLTSSYFHPAGDPPLPGENLYLDYPIEYGEMPDGKLPDHFPPPFPDDGGVDSSGVPTTAGAGNKMVDPNEFNAIARDAVGTISGGLITALAPGQVIDSVSEVYDLMNVTGPGTNTLTNGDTHAPVVLVGTKEYPLTITGTVAIDGDVVIKGYVKGEGTILASGNVYIPGDLQYADGEDSHGVTFGVAADGTANALGVACGGNMMIGDFLMPSGALDPDAVGIVTGGADGSWNFSLAEMSLFNRGEWAHTQPTLIGPNSDPLDPTTWIANPTYIEDYVPRYYQFGPGDEIPIYNLGDLYFDPQTQTWRGDDEVPLSWDPEKVTMLDPDDTSNPLLYNQQTGDPLATVLQVTADNGWITEEMLKQAIDMAGVPEGEADRPKQIDGLLYTNNAIFGIVPRGGRNKGQLIVNGALVCADLGLLAPGYKATLGAEGTVPGSPYAAGLRLNYDKRTKTMLRVENPYSVTIKRALWRPTANML